MNNIKSKLRNFKLAGMASSLEERLLYANNNKLNYAEFLDMLCDDEENNRRDNSYKKRYSKSKINSHKTLENFDFSYQPSINEKQVNDLSLCKYIAEKKNLIFIGRPGTGKTHLATALALSALKKDYKVFFTKVSEMLYQLHLSKADNTYYKKLNEYLAPDLLILDELGFREVPSYSSDDFFEVISKRYENSSCIVTTNKSTDQWGDIFSDNILSSAILDRLMHHSITFKINGPSYRTRNIEDTTLDNEEVEVA